MVAYTIDPIPTKYNSVTYRSQLEAKWSLFFTKYGIYHEYESYRFKVRTGYYLPDFHLPEFKCYVEIKPTLDFASKDLLGRLADVSSQIGNAWLIAGPPQPNGHYVIVFRNGKQQETYNSNRHWLRVKGVFSYFRLKYAYDNVMRKQWE